MVPDSALNDHIAGRAAGQEKLERSRLVKELLDCSIREILAALVCPPGDLYQRSTILDPISEDWKPAHFFIGVEESKNGSSRPHDAKELSGHLFDHRRTQILKRIPNQRRVERCVGELQNLVQETLRFCSGLLAFNEVRTETLLHQSQHVF